MQRETVSGGFSGAGEPGGPDGPGVPKGAPAGPKTGPAGPKTGPEGPGDLDATVARWRASLAREFPRWYVWQGVAGHYYARVPRTSPPLVVRALNAEDLRGEISRAELFGWPLPTRARLRDHCA